MPDGLKHTFHPSLYVPSHHAFPSGPKGVICATAETTDGAQHQPEREGGGE